MIYTDIYREFYLLNLLVTLDVVNIKVVAIVKYILIDLRCLVIVLASFWTTKVESFGMGSVKIVSFLNKVSENSIFFSCLVCENSVFFLKSP